MNSKRAKKLRKMAKEQNLDKQSYMIDRAGTKWHTIESERGFYRELKRLNK